MEIDKLVYFDKIKIMYTKGKWFYYNFSSHINQRLLMLEGS